MDKEQLALGAETMRRSWLAFFVRNWHMCLLMLIITGLGGIVSILSLPVESDPEVKIPIATIITTYPGASPGDVEKLVTDELEEAIDDLDDVSEVTSTSSLGVSAIVVEFEANADLDASIRKLRDEIDTARADLPADAHDPVVTQIRAGDVPIVTFALTGKIPLPELKRHADAIEELLKDIRGVNKVEVSGLPERELQVLMNVTAMEGYGLSPSAVTQAISQNHIDLPVGTIRTDGLTYQASFKGQLDDAETLESLVIASRNGRNIFLRDIARVREAFAETASESQLYEAGNAEGEASVALQVFKKVGADLTVIVDEAKVAIDGYVAENLPANARVVVTDDLSDDIRKDVSTLLNTAWQTVVLIGLILYLAMGPREALAAALSIPILYLISFIGLNLVGETFNFLTFFALILSLGVVVDTSTVMIEGTHEAMQEHGLNSEQASLSALSVYASPLLSGALTTMAAFVPLGLMSGIMGEYVKHIPITVNITLAASLFTALMLLPAIATRILRKEKKSEMAKPAKLAKTFDRVAEWYGKRITKILESRTRQRNWKIGMAAAFVVSLALIPLGILKFQMFSSVDADVFQVQVSAPEGTELERTITYAAEAELLIREVPELVRYVSIYGAGGSHKANVTVELTSADDRSRTSAEIADALRAKFAAITNADVTIEELQAGPPAGKPIEIRLVGKDSNSLQEFAFTLKKILEQTPGTKDVADDLDISPGEFHITPKRDRMEYFGVTAVQIASILRTSAFGSEAVSFSRNGEEIPVNARLDFRSPDCENNGINRLLEEQDQRTICRTSPETITQLKNLLIPTSRGEVPMAELVDVSLQAGITTIRHYDGERVVRVLADIQEGFVAGDVLAAFQQKMEVISVPRGVGIGFGGESEDTQESFNSFLQASLVGVFLIFMILVYQFGSFRQVRIILVTMPLGIMGVLYGLAFIRLPLSFPGLIGVAALLGIVVNDAIVLIDRFNTLLKLGYPLIDAVKTGCKQRLQPVIITSMTTAFGVFPLIFSSEVFRDLAIVIAIGITIATIFTLVMIPILFLSVERGEPGPLTKTFWWIWNWLKWMLGQAKAGLWGGW